MKKWRNFFLQRMGEDVGGSSYPVCESVKTWGIWCKDIPFKIIENVKEPAIRTWNDEHGDDEYIPEEGLYVSAYTMEVEFGCKVMPSLNDDNELIPSVANVRINVGAFLEYLRTSGMMNMYSSYTRIGRQNVRLQSVGSDAQWWSDEDGEFLIFKVTFKVNDPVTNITLSI